jgi:hypothetical protein
MTAFDQVVRDVEEHPLNRSLAVSLRIARAIRDDQLATWIRLELMGYLADNPAMNNNTMVPEYRAVPGQWCDDYLRPLVLDDPKLQFINELRLRQGVTELEGLASAKGLLSMRAMEFSELIRKGLDVEVSLFQFHPAAVNQVLADIKLQLLDQLAARNEAIAALPELTKPAESEILHLKPGIYGVSVDLKALWRWLFKFGGAPLRRRASSLKSALSRGFAFRTEMSRRAVRLVADLYNNMYIQLPG